MPLAVALAMALKHARGMAGERAVCRATLPDRAALGLISSEPCAGPCFGFSKSIVALHVRRGVFTAR